MLNNKRKCVIHEINIHKSYQAIASHSYSLSFFRHGNFSSVTCTHALFLSFLPLVFPLWREIDLSILIVLLLYPNWLMSGLSLRLPSCRCLPKNSSAGSWQNRSVRTYSIPSWRRNLVDSMVDWTVSWKPSYVCQERNMRALAFWLKFPGLFSVLSFQLLRYSRNSIKNWNLWKMLKKNLLLKNRFNWLS